MKHLILAAVMLATSAGAALAQDAAAGEATFKHYCYPCHAIGEGAKTKVGPELNGLDGRHSGTAPGFHYSEANVKSGIVWGEATFSDYIKDPRAKIPGTKMFFAGIKDEKEIANLWAYLKSFAADGKKK